MLLLRQVPSTKSNKSVFITKVLSEDLYSLNTFSFEKMKSSSFCFYVGESEKEELSRVKFLCPR